MIVNVENVREFCIDMYPHLDKPEDMYKYPPKVPFKDVCKSVKSIPIDVGHLVSLYPMTGCMYPTVLMAQFLNPDDDKIMDYLLSKCPGVIQASGRREEMRKLTVDQCYFHIDNIVEYHIYYGNPEGGKEDESIRERIVKAVNEFGCGEVLSFRVNSKSNVKGRPNLVFIDSTFEGSDHDHLYYLSMKMMGPPVDVVERLQKVDGVYDVVKAKRTDDKPDPDWEECFLWVKSGLVLEKKDDKYFIRE